MARRASVVDARNGADEEYAVPSEPVKIKPANFRTIEVQIRGTAPYMQCRFSEKAMRKMMDKQAAGQQSRSRKVLAPRDFDADLAAATHFDDQGRVGIPASAFRNAMISACRAVGFKMTLAKLSVFVEGDTLDAVDGMPLVFIEGEPERSEMVGRNADFSADVRIRPMWREWSCKLRIKWDADQFSVSDVVNLLSRAGAQVGIGDGRPDSRKSAGMGLGTFEVAG